MLRETIHTKGLKVSLHSGLFTWAPMHVFLWQIFFNESNKFTNALQLSLEIQIIKLLKSYLQIQPSKFYNLIFGSGGGGTKTEWCSLKYTKTGIYGRVLWTAMLTFKVYYAYISWLSPDIAWLEHVRQVLYLATNHPEGFFSAFGNCTFTRCREVCRRILRLSENYHRTGANYNDTVCATGRYNYPSQYI